MAFDFSQAHTATQALAQVHERMKTRFANQSGDVLRAKEMQTYLQYFKQIFYHPELYVSNDPLLSSLGLEQDAIESMRTRFQQILGVSSKYTQIFRSEHKWYKNRSDFDDIVEGELNALLQVMAEKATGIKNINLGQKIVGADTAIVDLESLSSDTVNQLVTNIQEKISKKQTSKIIDGIQAVARSGKIDVTGYNKELIVSANIAPNFQSFINLFTGVNFSVKNYKGDSQYQIYLGNTNPFKAMYGSLTDLGYDAKSAVHIYSHSKMSYKKNAGIISRNNDIFHLRFMYELTGSGLIDAETRKPLNAVDFLIYNDPASDKIFVKSTKQMIAEILDHKNMKITNPWSGIYISKLDFH